MNVTKENSSGIGVNKIYGGRSLYEGTPGVVAGSLGDTHQVAFTFDRTNATFATWTAPARIRVLRATISVVEAAGGTGNVDVRANTTVAVSSAAAAAAGTNTSAVGLNAEVAPGQTLNVVVPGTVTGTGKWHAVIEYVRAGGRDGN